MSRFAVLGGLAAIASVASILLPSCGLTSQYTAEEGGTNSVAVTGAPTIVVETFNGNVGVSAGPAAGTVEVAWTKRGSSPTSTEDAKADLANVEVTVRKDGDTVRVVAKRTDGRTGGSSGATFTLTVPRGCPLSLTSSNGGLSVRGIGGPVTAVTSNGRVSVSDAKGGLTLTSSNGTVEGGGDGVVLAIRSSKGSLRFSGSLADGSHSAATSNGGVEVTLPKDARFVLDAETSNGKVTCDFPITSTAVDERKGIEGTVGADPKARLTIETSNGSIHVGRAP